MNTKQNAPRSISQKIIDEYISQLLAKTEEDDSLDIELYGYPADYLDNPRYKRTRKQVFKNRFFEGMVRFVEIVVMKDAGDDILIGNVFASKTQVFLVDVGGRKLKIAAKKLRSLLDANVCNGRVITTKDGDVFVIRLDTRLLLDYCV